MSSDSLVSVIIIFLNAERFIEQAIQSVFAQTYERWELLLVDDGSTDGSVRLAQRCAAQHPEQVYYLEHSEHRNRGKGSSRNLGLRSTSGEYVAFLDADDVWLPHKLEEQVAILDSQPQAGMLYGKTKYWYNWTQHPQDAHRDFVPRLGVQSNTLFEPPRLLASFLRGKAVVPCTCSILVRRSVAREVGGFEEVFRGPSNIYEDQAFYAKVCLGSSVYVSALCLDWYRQHPAASMAVARRLGQEISARRFFLRWLQAYLCDQGVQDAEVWHALRCELWRIRSPAWLPHNERLQYLVRWAKKWLLRAEDRLLPPAVRYWLHK
jgi:glycosyltransferase involved in cell wall biosynthesis